jgi:hypothetical protein
MVTSLVYLSTLNWKKMKHGKFVAPNAMIRVLFYSSCYCKGDLTELFLDKKTDYFNCISICNHIDCYNSQIKYNNEIIYYPGETALK